MSMEQHQVAAPSPQVLSRIGGVLYLIIIVIGLFGEVVVRNRIIVPGDATATAANIGSLQSLWRFGIAAEFVLLICAVILSLILFVLLRPVSRDLALLAVFFNLVSIAVEAVAALNLVAALFPLGHAGYLSAFKPEQLYAMASLSVKSHSYGFGVALIFFGCECLVLGYLIFRSGYLPKAVGVLMQIAGLCYVTNSFALLLSPSFANRIFPAILVPAFIGEVSLCLWLLVKGVNVEKWKSQAGVPPTGIPAASVLVLMGLVVADCGTFARNSDVVNAPLDGNSSVVRNVRGFDGQRITVRHPAALPVVDGSVRLRRYREPI